MRNNYCGSKFIFGKVILNLEWKIYRKVGDGHKKSCDQVSGEIRRSSSSDVYVTLCDQNQAKSGEQN
jgi:hypothetical protein